MSYLPTDSRYASMHYTRWGLSGLKLPAISLGLWHNFGGVDDFANSRLLVLHAFDLGITHFDRANNYGPTPGSAEENFGRSLHHDLKPFRDELLVTSKAGYLMWPGPYGDRGSRKYLIASLDQSLKRLGLDYVDIFYHHFPDPETPLEETMGTLDYIVRSGRALYVGISQYKPEGTKQAAQILRSLGTPLLIHQPNYNMFDRWIEQGLLDVLKEEGVGSIVFSPLAQGLLTDKYLKDFPSDSRDGKEYIRFFNSDNVTEAKLDKVRKLNDLAKERNQSLAQMSLAWVLRQPVVTTALIGASKVSQIEDAIGALQNLNFSNDELKRIDEILFA